MARGTRPFERKTIFGFSITAVAIRGLLFLFWLNESLFQYLFRRLLYATSVPANSNTPNMRPRSLT